MDVHKNLVILAGGISSRMKKSYAVDIEHKLLEDANKKSKSMIGVGKNYRPFLDYLLFNANDAGYEDVTIVISEMDDSIKYYYGNEDKDNRFLELKISYATQKIPAGRVKPAGTADALYQALIFRKDWTGKKFTVCNSDNLYSVNALRTMMDSEFPNAMCDYNRAHLEFETSRIEKFAVTLKDEKNFLIDIFEKPDSAAIANSMDKNGVIGVSMNIFNLDYDMTFPFLEAVPYNPERNEKELPDAIKLMIKQFPQSLYAYPFAEHVPDLTIKNDIISVKEYLEKNFASR